MLKYLTDPNFEQLIEIFPEGAFVLDKYGTVKLWNRLMHSVTGITKEEVVGSKFSRNKLTGTDHPPFAFLVMHKRLNEINKLYDKVELDYENNIFSCEYARIGVTGELVHLWIKVSLIYDNSEVAGAIEFIRDVSNYRRTRERLREQTSLLTGIIKNLPAMVYRCKNNEKRDIIYIGGRCEQITGYDSNDFLENRVSLTDLIHPDDLDSIWIEIQMAIKEKKPYTLSYRIKTKDSGLKWIWERGSCVEYDGIPAEDCPILEGVIDDVSEEMQAKVELEDKFKQIKQVLAETVNSLGHTVQFNDVYTYSHQVRCSQLARRLCIKLGLDEPTIDGIVTAAKIHDIGKIGIPKEILIKPSRLTHLEYALVKEHSKIGYEIINKVPFCEPISDYVLQHHERIDGSGYPHGLEGTQILFGSKILSICDVVESMATHRPYRPARGIEEALNHIKDKSGILYDPTVVELCCELFEIDNYKLDNTLLDIV